MAATSCRCHHLSSHVSGHVLVVCHRQSLCGCYCITMLSPAWSQNKIVLRSELFELIQLRFPIQDSCRHIVAPGCFQSQLPCPKTWSTRNNVVISVETILVTVYIFNSKLKLLISFYPSPMFWETLKMEQFVF